MAGGTEDLRYQRAIRGRVFDHEDPRH